MHLRIDSNKTGVNDVRLVIPSNYLGSFVFLLPLALLIAIPAVDQRLCVEEQVVLGGGRRLAQHPSSTPHVWGSPAEHRR